jgi:hypothetical protein
MECDYTHLNHNSFVSNKKSGHQRWDYKGGLLYLKLVNEFFLHMLRVLGPNSPLVVWLSSMNKYIFWKCLCFVVELKNGQIVPKYMYYIMIHCPIL